MTLASDIISDAYRETNIIPLGVVPTANQTTEALTRLNVIISSLIGNEVGDPLDDINVGGTYDQSEMLLTYIPDDSRLVLNLSASETFNLDPYPYEGQRLSFIDVGNNLATYNVVLDGNGRNIEGAATLTLNTDGDSRQWMYRGDTGNWVKLTTLISSDAIPYPTEFDDFFVTTLAMRLNPRYGQSLAPETIETMKRMRSQLRSRYHAYRQIAPDLDTRGFLNDQFYYRNDNMDAFNKGLPFWPR